MKPKAIVRIGIDIGMTVLLLLLMAYELIGSGLHSEIVTSELKRFIIEALMVNPYILELSNFQFTRTDSGVQVEFDCTTVYGAEQIEWEAKEVRVA